MNFFELSQEIGHVVLPVETAAVLGGSLAELNVPGPANPPQKLVTGLAELNVPPPNNPPPKLVVDLADLTVPAPPNPPTK